MKKIYTSIFLLIASLALSSFTMLRAQLYVGNGGTVYISRGDSLYVNDSLEVASGATVTNNSIYGITLTGAGSLNGLMEYTAAGNQNILPFNHQSLLISGSGNKILNSNVNISTALQLDGTAKLLTGNNILSLTGTSSFITGVPAFGNMAGSWIVTGNGNGGATNTGLGGLRISNIGSGARSGSVLFPVGPTINSYTPITLSNSGTTDDFAVAVNDQTVPGAPADETVNATWNISEAIPGGSNVTLGTQWNVADEALSFVRAICGIVHSNGTTVDYFAAAGAASGSNPYTQTGTGFKSFSPFGVTSNATVLPVNFLGIKGYQKGSVIQVDWNVAAETSIKLYEVQKSITGTDFTTVVQLTPTGNNNSRQSYGWPDRNPVAGANFYRVRSIGLNGSYKYSNIIKVDYATDQNSITAFPNPVVDNKFSLAFYNKGAGNYQVKIVNLAGQLVYSKKIVHNGIDAAYPMQLTSTLAGSMYQVKVEAPDGSVTIIKLLVHP